MISTEKNCTCVSSEDEKKIFSEISSVIERHGAKKDCLIQILHEAQNIYGYLPDIVTQYIADSLEMSVSQVSGVVSFYSFFTTKPHGRHTIRVCMGTACYVRGGKKITDHIKKVLGIQNIGDTTSDGKFTFEIARCIGACGLAPAIMIDDVVYKQMTPNKMDLLLAKFD